MRAALMERFDGPLPIGAVPDPACPVVIVRAFLRGLFGGDGHACILKKYAEKLF